MASDVLGEVLATLELSSRIYFRAELRRPFAVAVPEERGLIRFHAVTEGACTLRLEGSAPLALGPGDLAMVPHGAAHVLGDAPERAPRPLDAVLAASGFDGSGPLVYGGDGERCVLVCGHYAFGAPLAHPWMDALPAVLTLRAGAAHAPVPSILARMEHEAHLRRPGHEEVMRRLAEILLIEALRTHAEGAGPAALSALVDPGLGRALQAMHEAPAADWSLEALARVAGLSRTLFVERFRDAMGVPPMKYLAAWRMQRARRLLARSDCSVAEVARSVGYASESAFNRGFRARFGAPPGVWRRARTAEPA